MASRARKRETMPAQVEPDARRADGRRRREAILDAAIRCFAERGVLGTGIEHIRREAGASPSSMYHQFPDIDAIMLALLLRIFEDLFASLEARVARAKTPERAIRSLVEAHIDWIASHPAEGRFMYQAMSMELGRMSEASRARLVSEKARLLGPLVEHLAPFMRRGELPRWSPPLFDVVVLGAAHEGLRRWLAGAEELGPATLKKMLPKLAWRAIDVRP